MLTLQPSVLTPCPPRVRVASQTWKARCRRIGALPQSARCQLPAEIRAPVEWCWERGQFPRSCQHNEIAVRSLTGCNLVVAVDHDDDIADVRC